MPILTVSRFCVNGTRVMCRPVVSRRCMSALGRSMPSGRITSPNHAAVISVSGYSFHGSPMMHRASPPTGSSMWVTLAGESALFWILKICSLSFRGRRP